MAVTMNGINIPLPPTWAETQMKTAFQESVVGKLTPSVPIPLGAFNVPVYEGGFEMGYVPEMGSKPVSNVAFSMKTMSPIKLAGIIVISEEAARANPAQMLQTVQADMRNAVSRAVDYAVLYGKSAYNGTAIPGAVSVDSKVAGRIELDFTKDMVPQLLNGYNMIVSETADPNGWAFDTLLRARLALATQQNVTLPGAPMPTPDLTRGVETLMGLPAAFGRTVAGRVGTQTDTKTRGYLGDWTKLRWGFSTDISFKSSDTATIIGSDGQPIYLFQQNARALLIEVGVGWTVLGDNAFVAYDDKVAG